jgi:carbonic anhydrase
MQIGRVKRLPIFGIGYFSQGATGVRKEATVNRSNLLRNVCCALAAVPAAASLAGNASAAEEAAPHWTYGGENGPGKWGELSPDFKTCSIGLQQSPIDLKTPVIARIGALGTSYRPAPLSIVNNGHTIQVNYAPGSTLAMTGRSYQLVQFHFHTPSEHLVGGKPHPMELHLVHADANKSLAVIGVFIDEGAAHVELKKVWAAIPAAEGPAKTIAGVQVDASRLLPVPRGSYYEYLGSLTTPPCSEDVRWIVLPQPITASAAQIAQFRKLFPLNARPVNKLNQRLLLEQI